MHSEVAIVLNYSKDNTIAVEGKDVMSFSCIKECLFFIAYIYVIEAV